MKNYVKHLLILVFCMCALLASADSISGELHFDETKVKITKLNGYDFIEYEDDKAYYEHNEGTPYLPVFDSKLILPAGATGITITVTTEESGLIGSGINCYPTQKVKIISIPDDTFTSPDKTMYSKNTLYPSAASIEILNTSIIRGYNVLNVKAHPLKLNPVTKELFLVTSLTYTVSFDVPNRVVTDSYPYNRVFENMINESVQNPADTTVFYNNQRVAAAQVVDLLVITNDLLKPAFTNYAASRGAAEGLTYQVLSLTEIDSLYTGPTTQLRIKNCIYDYSKNKNTTYVILGGDSPVVPDQDTFGDIGGTYVDKTIPCDTFYACFDKQFDWNANGNDKIGEPEDNPDLAPDAIIGRISVNTSTQVNEYLQKVNRYKNATHTDAEFVKKVMLAGVKLWHPGDAQVKSDALYNDYIKDYWPGNKKITLYDNDPGITLTTYSLSAKLNQGVNIMHMATHGDYKAWSMEAGGKFTTEHANVLSSHVQGTVITIACLSNGFDQEPCLGEAFTRNPNGGSIIYIGASRYGLGDANGTAEHGPSLKYNRAYFKNILTSNDNNSGKAFMMTKQELTAQTDHKYMRWVHFCLNFLGDPTINMAKTLTINTPTPTATPIPVTPTPYYVNVAINKQVVASGEYGPAYKATNINDGNLTTVWGSAYNKGAQWVYVDLGKQTAVENVVIKFYDPYYSPYYYVGVSNDAITWDFAATITNGDGGNDTVTLNQTTRYIGLYLTQGKLLAYGIKEFEVLEKRYPPTPTMTPTPTPTATTTPPPTKPPFDFWEVGVYYNVGDKVFYNDNIWRCNSAHTSTALWYPGAPGVYFWRLDN